MIKKWHHLNRTLGSIYKKKLEYTVRQIRFLERVDIIYIFVCLCFFLVFTGICFFGVKALQRSGFFDPPIVQKLSDERILVNVRDHIDDKPIRDAKFHSPDGHVYISQKGGYIHKYHPPTHLWSTETPFEPIHLNNSDLMMLRSGCGTDKDSIQYDQCPDPESLWGITRDGALVRHKNEWEIIVSDTRFIGKDGKPVVHSQITAAATSQDQNWLVFGTKSQGIGIYDVRQRLWRKHKFDFYDITHIVWWKNNFWIGIPNALFGLSVKGSEFYQLEAIDIPGRILDLDINADDTLWILTQHVCKNKKTNCLWIATLENPRQQLNILMNEQNIYPQLDLADFNFAQQWKDILTIAGKAGIYSYNSNCHSWKQHFDKTVLATLPYPNSKGFYFGFHNGIGSYNKDVRKKAIPNEKFIKLTYAQSNEVLALSETGNLYSYKQGNSDVVFKGTRTNFDPDRFESAVLIDDSIFFNGPQGALLHNIENRHYQDILFNQLPQWLRSKNTFMISSGGYIYVLFKTSKMMSIVRLPSSRLKQKNFKLKKSPITVPYPVRKVKKFDKGIGLIASDERAYHIVPKGHKALTGPSIPEMNRLKFYDVTSAGYDFIVSTKRGIRIYKGKSHSWNDFFSPRVDSKAIELDICGNQIVYRTDKNRLAKVDKNNPLLIGDHRGFSMSDKGVSDVYILNNNLFIAGQGAVERYNMSLRRITKRWKYSGKHDVKIKDIITDVPLAYCNKKIYFGDKVIDAQSGDVVNVSINSDQICTVREQHGRRYIKLYQKNAPFGMAQCFFQKASIGNHNTKVIDAYKLDNERIVVLATTGLYLYNQYARSWTELNGLPNKGYKKGRLYFSENHLILSQNKNSGIHLSFIPASSIIKRQTCSEPQISVSVNKQLNVKAFAMNDLNNQVAWIDMNDNVVQWKPDKQENILLSPGSGPPIDQIRRAFDRTQMQPGYLLFTTSTTIYKYYVKTRNWQKISFDSIDASQIKDINIENQSGQETILITTHSNDFYIGELSSGKATVKMNLLFSPAHQYFNSDPDALVDVQNRGGPLWTFVLKDRIKYFNPQKRKWQKETKFSYDPSLSYKKAAGCDVVETNHGKTWWIGLDDTQAERFARYDINSKETTAISSDKDIWRLTQSHVLYKCSPSMPKYHCVQYKPSPFLINPKQVNQAFEWKNFIIFETSDQGIRIYYTLSEKEIHVQQSTLNFKNTIAQQFENYLLMKSNNGLFLFDYIEKDIVYYSNNSEITCLDHKNRLWLKNNHQWMIWKEKGFEPLKTQNNQQLKTYAIEGGSVTGIDNENFPYYYQNGQMMRDEFAFPEEIDNENIKTLIKGNSNDWWVISDQHIDHIVREVCSEVIEETLRVNSQNCFKRSKKYELPGLYDLVSQNDFLQIETTRFAYNPGFDVYLSNGECLRFNPTHSGEYDVTIVQKDMLSKKNQINNNWSILQKNIATLKDGTTAYNPIESLEIGPIKQELLARKKTGTTHLATSGSLKPELPQALDAGWIKWDRKKKSFQVATSTGLKEFKKEDFIINKKLLFEDVDAILAQTTNQIQIANKHGIWKYTKPDISLSESSIIFTPQQLSLPVYAVHGTFIEKKDRKKRHIIRFGDVKISEQIWKKGITATYQLKGIDENAFDGNQFIWDKNRSGLAFKNDGTLILQSLAGIHPVNQLKDFDSSPQKRYLSKGKLIHEPGKGIFFYYKGQWFALSGTKWISNVKDPTVDRDFFVHPMWTWKLKNNQFQVDFSNNAYNFQIQSNHKGFGFSSDHLKDATFHNNQLFVLTDAFFEIADKPVQIANYRASRLSSFSTDKIETVRFSSGNYRLFHKRSGRIYLWNPANKQFNPVPHNQNPYVRRELASTHRLRFTLFSSNRVKKELRLDTIDKGARWVSFHFSKHQFPFDIVTSIASAPNNFYVGSAAGLQVYSKELLTGLDNLQYFYDLRKNERERLPIRLEVGFPESDSKRFMARSKTACIEKFSGNSFQNSQNPQKLNNRLRVKNSLWQWVSRSGKLDGHYLNQNNQYQSDQIYMIAGRFPHDHLKDFIFWHGRAFTLWKSDWITVSNQLSLELNHSTKNFDMEKEKPIKFVHVKKNIPLINSQVDSGLYIEGKNRHFWKYSNKNWIKIQDKTIVKGLISFSDRPPVVQYQNFRLLPPKNKSQFVFEQRTLDGHWHALPWKAGRVSIDHWHEVAYRNNVIWASTPAGIVSFYRKPKGSIKFNPDALIIVREPFEKNQLLRISDFEYINKKFFVRCNSDSSLVFSGKLKTSQDSNIFEKYTGKDPFVSKNLVKNDYWKWYMEDHKDGDPGSLNGILRDESIHLAGGRFEFDTINSLALFDDRRVDIGTTSGGWFHAPKNSFHVRDFKRPQAFVDINVKKVNRVHVTLADHQKMLCLESVNHQFYRLNKDKIENVRSCADYLCDDGFWQYMKNNKSISIITSKKITGSNERKLKNGRFTDDIVTGLPVTGKDIEGTYYLLPTLAGIYRINKTDMKRSGIYQPPFQGLPENLTPQVLFIADHDDCVYSGKESLYLLSEFQKPYTKIKLTIPKKSQLQSIAYASQNLIRYNWINSTKKSEWALYAIDNTTVAHNTIYANLDSFSKFNQNKRNWGNPTGWMRLIYEPGMIYANYVKSDNTYQVNIPSGFELISPIIWHNRLLLIGKNELLEISLEEVMVNAFNSF